MNKEVDNGVKKFFIIFLGFIVVLNILSILLFSHSLFYYFTNVVGTYGWGDNDTYNNILKHSMSGKCFIPIILVCFCLFLIFTIKHVKRYRRYIYPIMYIVFLFILEFIVLCFFKECLSYMQTVSAGVLTALYGVRPYIPVFYPFSFISCIIYSFLITIGNIFDNKSVGKKNSLYVIVISMILSFIIVVLIGTIVGIILSNI